MFSNVCVALLLLLFPIALPMPRVNKRDAEVVSVELVGTADRVKRSPDTGISDNLQFKFPLVGKDIHLRLKRSKLIPVITTSGREESHDLQERGVFMDIAEGSSMIVKRSADEYILTGRFTHRGREYDMEPVPSAAGRDNRSLHIVIPIGEQDYDMDNDALKPPGDLGEEIILQNGRNNGKVDEARSHEQLSNKKYQKRQAEEQRIVEISMIADHSDWKRFVEYYGSDNAVDEMRNWYTHVANLINIRYDSIDSIKINTRVVKLLIFDNSTSSNQFIENLADDNGTFNGSYALESLREYVREHILDEMLPESDHYMYFTALDIDQCVGIAYVGTVCYYWAVSVIENTLSGHIGAIAAHELGHSLSSDHDSVAECPDSGQYVMSAKACLPIEIANEGNGHRFSRDSVAKMTTYLSDLGSYDCTLPEYTAALPALPAEPRGKVPSRDEQCKTNHQNSSSRYCHEAQYMLGSEDDICRGLYCLNPGEWSCSPILPMEYTACGESKWCVMGYCVDSTPVSPSTAEPITPACNESWCTTSEPTTYECAEPGCTTPEPTTTEPTTPEPTTTEPTTPKTTSLFDCFNLIYISDFLQCIGQFTG